jgi:hypothetical protein
VRLPPLLFCLACSGWAAHFVFSQSAASPSGPPQPPRISSENDSVLPPTPIDDFRHWLSLGQSERTRVLALKPESKRKTLQAKLVEYSALPQDLREQRLNVLQLRWYLIPLMETPTTNRASQLVRIPLKYRALAESRLKEWDLLPPPLQKDVLDKETTRQYFVRLEASKPSERERILNAIPTDDRQKIEKGVAHWRSMSRDERLQTYAQFDRFFELTPEEKGKTLGILSEEERQQMVQTLKTFQQLPREQRQVCIESFRKFASLTPSEREEFLKNAERWREMSQAERQTWRDLVTVLPPLPPGLDGQPPLPPLPTGGQ